MSESKVRHASQSPTFAELLRQHRTAATLSQEALAERAGLSVRAISDLERGVKTRPYLGTVRMLADALELTLTERGELAAAARPERNGLPGAHALAGAGAIAGGLPVHPMSLVGRDDEVESVAEWLCNGPERIVTMAGPAGVGKTRLASAVSHRIAERFSAGAIWVELAPVGNPLHIPSAVAQALRLREPGSRSIAQSLNAALSGRRLLLILDNCEHVLQSARDLVRDLVDSCPDLTVLTTSRAPLRVGAERVVSVEPLELPEGDEPRLKDVAGAAAVQLFVQRARQVRPSFDLTDDNMADVAEICRSLDGLPLAIELAAVRMRLLSATALRALLSERLRLLVGGPSDVPERLKTLRNAIAWSYELLEPEARSLFRRLAIFVGGFGFEAATAISANCDAVATMESLEALLDQNLIVERDQPDGIPRFGMLETIREFGLEKLAEHGEIAATEEAHGKLMQSLVERLRWETFGPNQGRAFDQLEAEQGNVRAALGRYSRFQTGADRDAALRIVGGLGRFWQVRGNPTEARSWVETVLSASDDADPALIPWPCIWGAVLSWYQGDFASAKAHTARGLAVVREAMAGPSAVEGTLWFTAGLPLISSQDLVGARAAFEQSVATCDAAHNAPDAKDRGLVKGHSLHQLSKSPSPKVIERKPRRSQQKHSPCTRLLATGLPSASG